jgi:hypothetical protein
VHQDEDILALLFEQWFVEFPPAAASALYRQQEFPELSHGNHLLLFGWPQTGRGN